MSAAALNLLMMNCSRHHEAALDPRHPGVSAPGPAHSCAAPCQPPHPDYPDYPAYPSSYPHLLQYARQDTPAPVCQLKRLHPGATNTATELLRCQRRRTQLPGPSPGSPSSGPPPYGRFAPILHRQVSSVARRNERERNRVRLVNHGFALLQQHVPAPAARSRRMSKVDTLKAAVGYIRQLRAVLQRADHALIQPASPASPPPSPSPPQAAAAGGTATPAPAPLPLHRRLYPQCGSLSPSSSSSSSSSSSEEGSSCLDADAAVASPGEFSGSGSDAETSLLRDDHGPEDGGATEMTELVDFASWFC